MGKTMYGYWFICNKCGTKNTTTRDKPDMEQIQQQCSNEECGKTSYYTRPGCRGHHGKHSNLYLEGEVADTKETPETTKSTSLNSECSDAYLPTKEDFESAYRMLTRPGESISIDSVLNQIEVNAKNNGFLLNGDWRLITEKNIEVWSSTR